MNTSLHNDGIGTLLNIHKILFFLYKTPSGRNHTPYVYIDKYPNKASGIRHLQD